MASVIDRGSIVSLSNVDPHPFCLDVDVTRGRDYWDHGALKEGRALHVRVLWVDCECVEHVSEADVDDSDWGVDLLWTDEKPPAEVVAAVEGRL